MRFVAWLGGAIVAMAAASACAAPAAAPAARAAPTAPRPPAAAPSPGYAVVQAAHDASTDTYETVTVQCPTGLRVFGAGYAAVIRNPPPAGAAANAPVTTHEEGLENVRSMPDANGTGWQVQAYAPGAVATKQPWRLVVRAICVRVGP
jgi:hypothetical protein